MDGGTGVAVEEAVLNSEGMNWNKITALIFLFLAHPSFAQCKKQVSIENSFELQLPKAFEIIKASDSLQNIQSSFQGSIICKKDTVLAFVADDLYIQALLHIKQDVYSMDSIGAFDCDATDIQELKKDRRITCKKKGTRLIIIDCGPRNGKTKEQAIEFYCHDFSTGKTLVINSSSSLIHWNDHLQTVSRKMRKGIVVSFGR